MSPPYWGGRVGLLTRSSAAFSAAPLMPTLYKHTRNQLTATRMTVEQVVEVIRSKEYEEALKAFRSICAISSTHRDADGSYQVDEYWEQALPRICFAADYAKRKGTMQRVAYNGLVMLEVSSLQDTDEAISLRYYAGQLPQTLLTFLGADGRSIVIVCRAELLGDGGSNPLPTGATGATGVFRAAIGMAAAPQRGANPSFATEDFRVATGVATAPQRGANPSFATEVRVGLLPTDDADITNFHQNAFMKAQQFYTGQLGVSVDIVEPRLDRICYMSADAALFYNPNAIPFYVGTEFPLQLASPYRRPAAPDDPFPGYDQYSAQVLAVQTCLSQAYQETVGIEDEKEWITAVLSRQAHYCMESGIPKELALRLTLYHTRFKEERMLASTIFDNAYTPEALRKAARKDRSQAVLRHIPPSALLILRTRVFMEQNYQFRKNELTGVAQFRPVAWPYLDFRDVTDEDRNTMTNKALEAGLGSWDKDIRRYIESGEIPLYNPIDEYLFQLPKWDGRDRLAEFASRVPTDNALWHRYFPLWMRSMVAHWMGRDRLHGNALVPLLIGPQGCGKTTFCSIVLPDELRDYYNDYIDFTKKFDLLNTLSSFALVNIDEFDTITLSRQPELKQLLSKSDVKLRVPYGKTITRRRRYASFIATTNSLQPLSDPTGSRRFLCVRINGTIDTTSPVDYPQLYAQLLAEVKDNQRYWLTDDETAELMRHNERFRQLDNLEEMVQALFRCPEPGEEPVELATAEIVSRLSKRFPGVQANRSTFIKVGRVLSSMGCDSRHAQQGNMWTVSLQEN